MSRRGGSARGRKPYATQPHESRWRQVRRARHLVTFLEVASLMAQAGDKPQCYTCDTCGVELETGMPDGQELAWNHVTGPKTHCVIDGVVSDEQPTFQGTTGLAYS